MNRESFDVIALRAAVVFALTVGAVSTPLVVRAAVGADGLPSVEHIDRGARPETVRFSTRGAAARRVQSPTRSVADIAQFRAAQRASREPGQPLLIGAVRDLPSRDREISGTRLGWQSVPGGQAAVLEFHADGARGLRLSFKLAGPSQGVLLRFAGSAKPGDVIEVGGAATVGSERYWGPVTEGDTLRVEIFVADGVAHRQVRLAQLALMHMDQVVPLDSVNPTEGGLGQATLACHRDVACNPNQSPAYLDATRAVAGLSFVVGEQGFWCSGTLVNSNTVPRQPYLVTANHCINTAEAAASLYTVWFMEATACGSGQRRPEYFVLRDGATLLYNSTVNDHAFLRLNGRLPNGVFYAGWSPGGLGTGAAALGMHHPNADLKKYSEGTKEKDTNNLNSHPGTYHQVRWTTGAVEGGSSGSGLFAFSAATGTYQLTGQLLGTLGSGPSTCSSSALYGRLQDHAPTLRAWLDPAAPLAILNSASYQALEISGDELVAAWGPGLPQPVIARIPSDRSDASDSRCALTLGGRYSVLARSQRSGESKEACVLFLGAGQVNFKLPSGLTAGDRVDVSVIDNLTSAAIATATAVPVVDFAPGLFTASQDGKGIPAANLVRVRNGQEIWSDVPTSPSTPIDLGPVDEDLFLVLYGTGIRNKPGTTLPRATIAGLAAPVEYVGVQPSYLGLDQINLRVPKAELRRIGVIGKAIVEVRFTDASGRESVPNAVEIYIK